MSLTIDVEKDQLKCLELIAKNKNKDVNRIIAEIIDEYFEQLLDEELLKIAKKRSADIKSGKSEIFSHEEVMRENGLSD